MLFGVALIILIGFSLSGIFSKMKLPGLLGMILTGIILGPYVLNLISPEILGISADLREIALIVILARAGLTLDLKDLKKVGRPALLMCFIPATAEILLITFIGPLLFDMTYLEAAIMGSVVAAVSPAVVVPAMIKIMERRYGGDKKIPQLIMAGASIDDIYTITLFVIFMGMYKGSGFNVSSLLRIPVSLVLGLTLGVACGILLVWIFKKIHMRDTIKVLLILGAAFLMVTLENALENTVPVSGLLAVMALGGTILKTYGILAKRLVGKFSKIWVGAEMILFVLVGAAVNISYALNAGISAVILLLAAETARSLGVYLSLIKTGLNLKEKMFCAISYLPKATVQAAIGAIPLAAGVEAGGTILAVAVISIILTAPIGAIGINRLYPTILSKD